ncbi:MAG: hypothetical protein COA78_28475 [Blastopirellula sp.]|nr:MAG: hypothetical protein COA78_28475 [Blastopirellula sp.]
MPYDDRVSKKIPSTESMRWTCKNHPELVWYGKNIQNRTMFFDGVRGKGTIYQDDKGTYQQAEECKCPGADLIPDFDTSGPDVPQYPPGLQ